MCDDAYPFWETFEGKLFSGNAFIRCIGIALIAANTRWDREGRFEKAIESYLAMLNDEKPVVIRQCIKELEEIVPYKEHLRGRIAERLMALSISAQRETMQRPILRDIIYALAAIREYGTNDAIEEYFSNALTSGLLDKKEIRRIKAM